MRILVAMIAALLVGKLVVPEATLILNLFDTTLKDLLVILPLPVCICAVGRQLKDL